MTDEEQEEMDGLRKRVLALEGRIGRQEAMKLHEETGKLTNRVHELSEVLRPTEAELRRRAILEAEVMEALSHQRHHLDKILHRLCTLENPPPPPSVWRVIVWEAIEGVLKHGSSWRAWVARRVLN